MGGRVLCPVKAGWATHSTVLFGAVGVVMAALAITLFAVGGTPPEPLALFVSGFLAAVMGLQAAVARHIAVKDVTTVVVTNTITGFAADSRFGGAKNQPWFRRFAAIVLILLGAGVGALLLMPHIGRGIALTAVMTLTVTAIGRAAGWPHQAPRP